MLHRRPRTASRFLLLPVLLLLAVPVAAQIPEGMEEGTFRPHPEGERAISQLYSPFCPGFMLSQCPASESLALRDSIQAMAHAGWSSDELVDWMLGNHGEEYRAVPQGFGQGLLAWVLPPLALLLGAVGVFFALRRLLPSPEEEGEAAGSDPQDPEGPVRPVTDADERKLKEAIREIELAEDPSF